MKRRSGEIRVEGRSLPSTLTPSSALKAGIALVPADRLHEGGVRTLSMGRNITLPSARSYWHRSSKERTAVMAVVKDVHIVPPDPMRLFSTLSGGNQQKTIIGKWLLQQPSVLLLEDPTVGVDPGARRDIFSILRDCAERGLAVVLYSSEIEHLATLCQRVLILRDGVIAKVIEEGDELNTEVIARECWL